MDNPEKEETTFSIFGYEFYLAKGYLDYLDREDSVGWQRVITRTIFDIIVQAYRNS